MLANYIAFLNWFVKDALLFTQATFQRGCRFVCIACDFSFFIVGIGVFAGNAI